MDKTIGYARVSTEEQVAEGVSLEAQAERIRAYCQLNGLELTGIVTEEGVSAGKPLAEREGGQELLQALQSDGIRHVVALKLDRLFRDAIDCLTVVRDWDRAGIALHLIDQGGQAVNTQSAMGRFFLTIMAGVAEMERNLIGERTKIALQHKRRNGKVYGPEPFGYRREGEELLPDPQELKALSGHREGAPEAPRAHQGRGAVGGHDGEKDPGPGGGDNPCLRGSCGLMRWPRCSKCLAVPWSGGSRREDSRG